MVEEIITTFLVCVALPLGIVWLVTRARMQKNKLTSEIILAAIEKNSDIDIDEFAKSLSQKAPSTITPQERNQRKLQTGSASLIIAIGLAIFCIVTSPAKWYILASIILTGIGAGSLIAYFIGKKTIK